MPNLHLASPPMDQRHRTDSTLQRAICFDPLHYESDTNPKNSGVEAFPLESSSRINRKGGQGCLRARRKGLYVVWREITDGLLRIWHEEEDKERLHCPRTHDLPKGPRATAAHIQVD